MGIGTLTFSRIFINHEPEKYRDTYRENLEALIAAKVQGQTAAVPVANTKSRARVVDLTEALNQSLVNLKKPVGSEQQARKPEEVTATKRRNERHVLPGQFKQGQTLSRRIPLLPKVLARVPVRCNQNVDATSVPSVVIAPRTLVVIVLSLLISGFFFVILVVHPIPFVLLFFLGLCLWVHRIYHGLLSSFCAEFKSVQPRSVRLPQMVELDDVRASASAIHPRRNRSG